MQPKFLIPTLAAVSLSFAASALAQPATEKQPPTTPTTPTSPTTDKAPRSREGMKEALKKAESKPMGDFPTTMPVPPEAMKLGTVYVATSGKAKQITWKSDVPAEKIEGVSNNVVGFAVAGPKEDPANLKAGEWSVPVKSFDTKIPMRNGHMAGKDWLDAETYPNITFKLKSVKEAKAMEVKPGAVADASMKSYTATLIGDLSVHGVTKEITIPESKIRFRAADAPNADIVAPFIGSGEILFIISNFSINLGDYGVKNDKITQKVAEKIDIKVELILNTGDAPKSTDKPADTAKPKPAGS